MGVCLVMVRLSDAAIDEIVATPAKALHFWMQDEAPEAEPIGFLARFFGKKAVPSSRCSVPREEGDETDLDKAWDAMDYLLSDGRRIEGIARFLAEGGQEVPEEVGYGYPRVFRQIEVNLIREYLAVITPDILRARYDGPLMDQAEVYPQIWKRDRDEGFDYVLSFFEPMCRFLDEVSNRGEGVMIIYT